MTKKYRGSSSIAVSGKNNHEIEFNFIYTLSELNGKQEIDVRAITSAGLVHGGYCRHYEDVPKCSGVHMFEIPAPDGKTYSWWREVTLDVINTPLEEYLEDYIKSFYDPTVDIEEQA